MQSCTIKEWNAFKKWQYWLHRRTACWMAFSKRFRAEQNADIDAGYCLDRGDTNV